MPELPEVETVKRGLNKLVIGKQIISATSDNPKSFPNDQASVDEFMIGAKIIKVERRGKALIISLSTKYALVVHLKMTGQLVYVAHPNVSRADDHEEGPSSAAKRTDAYVDASTEGSDEVSDVSKTSADGSADRQSFASRDSLERFAAGHPSDSMVNDLPDRSTRVEITFSDKSKLYFNDQRKFGWMRLIPRDEVSELPFMKKLGPEPLVDSFTSDEFRQRIQRKKNSTVKAAILDQTTLAGVGNIYADESLFASGIHPARRVHELKPKQLERLLSEIKFVMNLAIERGGSTDRNYVDAEGKRGSYLEFAKVFRREGEPCFVDGTIILKTRVAGRGTHYCPTCQKPPRGMK